TRTCPGELRRRRWWSTWLARSGGPCRGAPWLRSYIRSGDSPAAVLRQAGRHRYRQQGRTCAAAVGGTAVIGALQAAPAWTHDPLTAMPETQIMGIAVAAVLLAVARSTWSLVGYPVTIVHELGHALAALSAGYRLRGITINGDMSGATNYWARGTAGRL